MLEILLGPVEPRRLRPVLANLLPPHAAAHECDDQGDETAD
jgi:hypothetical protein